MDIQLEWKTTELCLDDHLTREKSKKIGSEQGHKKAYACFSSIIAKRSLNLVQQKRFHVGENVRIVKTVLRFKKSYKQNFTDKVLEKNANPTLSLPTYSLIDAEEQEINGKICENELSLIGKKNLLLRRWVLMSLLCIWFQKH